MNTEALFLFLILLLGLVLGSFLGGNCGYEGFTTSTGWNANPIYAISFNPISTSGAATSAPIVGDNYNHMNGSMTSLQGGSILYGPNGAKLVVVQNSDGNQSLNVTLPNGDKIKLYTKKQEKQDTFTKTNTTSVEKYNDYYGANGSATKFYGPNGVKAYVIKENNGLVVIHVKTNQGEYTFTPDANYYSNNYNNNTQYYGSTGYKINTYQGAYGGNASSVTGPYGNTAYYATSPYGTNPYYNERPYGEHSAAVTGHHGNTDYGTTNASKYANSLPAGIPASQIPPGQEDLYILKSQVVPPVCPNVICPSAQNVAEVVEKVKEAKCPPCPPCSRCPEPSFECKKVPNYNSIGNNQLPVPVLNDFSTFGM